MSTVARKLSIMRPIPIVNEMATVNVAIATDVLLRELRMLLVATIPSNPNSFPQIGVSSFSENNRSLRNPVTFCERQIS